MKKIIEPVTRIEGHAKITVYLNDKEVYNANFDMYLPRGFEKILVGKMVEDVPRITSRICGLCSSAHAIAACKALEKIYDVTPSKSCILMRKLLLAGELMRSHALHFFYFALPDLKAMTENGYEKYSVQQFSKMETDLVEKLFRIIKIGNELLDHIGGRVPHPVTSLVGGVSKKLAEKEVVGLQSNLRRGATTVRGIIEKLLEYMGKIGEPQKFYNIDETAFMALNEGGNFNLYEGKLRIAKGKKVLADFEPEQYPQYIDTEKKSQGIQINGEKLVLTGPMARNQIIERYGAYEVHSLMDEVPTSWRESLLYSNFLRLIEILASMYDAILILNEPELIEEQELPQLNKIATPVGIGVVEAPRGTLIHQYKVNTKNIVESATIITPTELNLSTINQKLLETCRDSYQNTQDIEKLKENAKRVIRTFDPCVSCATHLIEVIHQ
ncbi:MAG: Ni/Fe hydrogenase subunit alpha [Candidatus Freyarchaeota archaeon]|nr:Ni/Fe hydrogenase subunit alpha [Candidatus Jordarchaeia archaeon]MBS7267214.1 Ni/Fe hydrogenase subunit alpha [Candidatus Jordarchaeia archaeon]MBS7278462.1 Ni/Fe hydrogenase subunit alpha [Candidatus Jordarchaeia archaeon]